MKKGHKIPAGRMQAIVARTTVGDVVTRELECGHLQVQQSGGRAKDALHARCTECVKPEQQGPPVLGTARIDGKLTNIEAPGALPEETVPEPG